MLIFAFWLSLFILAFIYVVYPCLEMLRAILLAKSYQVRPYTPSITVLIAAYNEQRCIQTRIENILSLDYPAELVTIVVASDGSDDGTCKIVEEMHCPNVQLLKLPRSGKGVAINAAAAAAQGDVLVFTDANSHFRSDALRQLVQPLADERVGGVAGNQVYTSNANHSTAADGEQMYWSFDRWLKTAQSAAGSVTSATGAIYAIRRSLFQSVPQFVMDDFFISTGVVFQGYRLVFAPKAIALEPVAADAQTEYQRKIRVAHQGLAAVMYRRSLLNPLRYGWYSWQLLSHKVLRRLGIIPLLVLFVASLLAVREGTFFQMALFLQITFYLLAAVPLFNRSSTKKQAKFFTVPYFFCLANVAAGIAVWRLLRGRQIEFWQPERHQTTVPANMSTTST